MARLSLCSLGMVALLFGFPLAKAQEAPVRIRGTIERLDPAFDKLIAKGARLEVLTDGYAWVEGPVWSRKGRYLLFSDIPNNSVFKWQEGKGASLFSSGRARRST